MRIALVIDSYAPTTTAGYGGSKYFSQLTSRFDQYAIQWRIITRGRSIDSRVTGLGPAYRRRDPLSKLLFSARLWARRTLFDDCDLIHSQSASSIPFLNLMARSGKPTLFDCRTSFVRTAPPLAAFQLISLALLPPAAVSFSDPVSRADYRRLVRRDAHYLPVPVDLDDALPSRPRSPGKTAVFATRLAKEKGFADVLDAMETLWANGSPVRLIVLGDGPLAGRARRMAARFRDKLDVRGEIASKDVASVLDSADILVHPSHTESISRSVLEAMARGLPVVGTPVGGMDSLAKQGLMECVAPGRPLELAATISRLLDDRDRRIAISDRAARYVRATHDSLVVFEQLLDLYRSLSVRALGGSAAS